MFKTGQLVRRIRADGYAAHDRTMHTANPGKTSSIGVPVFEAGVVVATLTLSYFSTAMTMEEALKRYADALKETAAQAGESLSNGPAEAHAGAAPAALPRHGEHAIPLHG